MKKRQMLVLVFAFTITFSACGKQDNISSGSELEQGLEAIEDAMAEEREDAGSHDTNHMKAK